MTRPTKIRIALALVVLGGLAWAAWPKEDPGAVSITFVGVSTNYRECAWFTITNHSKSSVLCGKWIEEGQAAQWDEQFGPPWGGQEVIAGRSATNWETGGILTNRWRIKVGYIENAPVSFVTGMRAKLGRFALAHNWQRLSQWIWSEERWRFASGPVMLGNQPAPLDQP